MFIWIFSRYNLGLLVLAPEKSVALFSLELRIGYWKIQLVSTLVPSW